MDVLLEAQFQRIESALEKLINSITAYNPSVPAAEELLQANDDLSDGLETLTKHQANHLHILALRQTASNLDAQVKSSLTQLAEARKELTNASLTAPADNSRDIPFGELIRYAQRISKYSVPPTYRPPLPLPLARREVNGGKGIVPPMPDDTAKLANGTPTSAHPGATPAAADGAGALAEGTESPLPQATEPEEERGVGWTALSDDQKAWLDSVARLQYVPWPSDNEVKSGALARIQAMHEQGMDPASMTKSSAALQEEARLKEEREQRELAELHERQRRGSELGPRPQPNLSRPDGGANFGLDLYDPDEG